MNQPSFDVVGSGYETISIKIIIFILSPPQYMHVHLSIHTQCKYKCQSSEFAYRGDRTNLRFDPNVYIFVRTINE